MTLQASRTYTREEITKRLAQLPRIQLAILPTPLQDCPRLTATLSGPHILIKRDDLTGLAFGGNKTRKLEFWMADARDKGANVVITGAGVQSNHCRQTVAAANKLGMKTVLVLFGKIGDELQGNLLLDDILGAEIINMEEGDHYSVRPLLYEVAEEYREKGYSPYVIDGIGPSAPLGAVAYVECAVELCDQLQEQGVTADYIVTASGSGGTHAGLALGAKLLGASFKVFGISVRRQEKEILPSVAGQANKVAEILGVDVSLSPDEVLVDDGYVGQGYGIPTDLGREAIRLAAQTEGIMLDPTYTGKVMSGLIDLIRQGLFSPDSTIVYLHTGGTPIIFARSEFLASSAKIKTITS